MKKLLISEQEVICGGQLSDAMLGVFIGVGVGAIIGSYRPNPSKACPRNWEEHLKQEREIYYKDGFAQGYEFGYGDGLTVAATGAKI